MAAAASWEHLPRAQVVQKSGVLARLGGDEFALLIQGQSRANIARLGNEVLRIIGSTRIEVNGGFAGVTGSVGVAMLGDADLSRDEALASADGAMYAAKEEGNCVIFAHPRDRRRSA